MRVVFMGTPEAAVPSLEAVASSFDVASVYTRPDRPKGRGRRSAPCAVKLCAERLGLEVVQPRTLKDEAEHLASYAPDAVAVVAYGALLPPAVLRVPRLGCVNVHFSLLPRWRGAAPVARAIEAGDLETGVVTMLMDEGMDTGPELLRERTSIASDDTTGTMTGRLSRTGAALLVRTLEGLERGSLEPVPQPAEGVTLARKVESAEAELDLGGAAADLERAVRAFDPAPGAFTHIGGVRLKVWRAAMLPGDGAPGTVVAVGPDGIDVQCGGGRLRLLEVQPEGKRRMTAAEFARGHRLEPGQAVGPSPV